MKEAIGVIFKQDWIRTFDPKKVNLDNPKHIKGTNLKYVIRKGKVYIFD